MGHFLKGSSATLGLIKIKNACGAIQNLGGRLDEAGVRKIGADEALEKIQMNLSTMKTDYERVKDYFSKCYPGI